MYHTKVMDWPTSDTYHLNLKIVPALPFCMPIIQDGKKVTFLSDSCLKIF